MHAARRSVEQPGLHGRFTRRRVVAAAAMSAGGLAVLASSCSGGASRGSPAKDAGAEGGKPRSGGTLRRRSVTNAFEGGFDPHVQQPSQTGEMDLFYQGLVRLNPRTLAVEPQLAQKWEQTEQTERKPFDDVRVTRALRLLVNHDEAIKAWAEVYFGRGYLTAYLPAALASWDLSEQEYRQYLEFKQPEDEAVREALSLLGAAGFTRENPLRFVLSGMTSNLAFSRPQSELMQAQFNQLSQGAVHADLKLLDEPHMRDALGRRDFEYVITNLVPGQAFEVDSWFRTFHYTNGSRNYGSFSDPVLDQMIDRQRGMFDTAARKAAVKQILGYLMDHAPYTSWSGRYNPNAAQLKVQGFVPEGNSTVWGYHYEQVWLSA